MFASISSLLGEGNWIYANLLLQITFLSLAAIILSLRFKNNAVVRYSILYRSLLALVLLCTASVFIQSRSAGFLLVQIDAPAAYFDRLFTQFAGDEQVLIEFDFPIENLNIPAESALQTTNAPLSFIAEIFARPIQNLPWYLVLQVIWLSGFLFSTIGLLRSLHNVDQITRRSKKLSAKEYRVFNRVMHRSESQYSGLQCRRSSEIHAPVLAGIASPVLLVPEGLFEHFDEAEIRAILRHEVAHVMRKDPICNFLQKLILSIFWFHPLVHQMDKMISRAREEICDNHVLSQEKAVEYGEVLFRLNESRPSHSQDRRNTMQSGIILGVLGNNWSLEQRIGDLLNHKREILMQLSQRSKTLLNVSVVTTALAISACQVTAQDDMNQLGDVEVTDQAISQTDGRISTTVQATGSRVSSTLGPLIDRKISEIQGLIQSETNSESNMELAKEGLDTLYEERFERMYDFEKSALLSSYTNYYLAMENYAEAANTFEEILTVENISQDIELRSMRSLGQLYAVLENWPESIRNYELWQAGTAEEDHLVYRGLSYAHYQLEQFEVALPHWVDYMTARNEDGDELTREDYAYLNGLHFTLENWEQALDTTKEMILLFNIPNDWENLRVIYRTLDEQAGTEQPGAA